MIFYSIEFLLYPFAFIVGIIILYIFTKANPVYFIPGLFFYIIFWIVLWVMLSLMYNMLPCVDVLGSRIGGC